MPIRRTSNKSSYDSGFYNPELYSDVGSRRIFEFDADALTYINAVEAADGEALEFNVKTAYNAFVVGCKSDGIWSAIKASCIMAGARTLSGALVPLVGVAPSGFSLASGVYIRASGLKGDGVSMYIDSNYAYPTGLQNNCHASVYLTVSGVSTSLGPSYVNNSNAGTQINFAGSRLYGITFYTATGVTALGTRVISRNNSSNYVFRAGGGNQTATSTSSSLTHGNLYILARSRPSGVIDGYGDATVSFYSIGEFLNAALLDNRVTVLMSGIQNAIP